MERLQKVLARAGVASRRASEELIRQGRVTVNGRVVREMGTMVDPAVDAIAVDGRLVAATSRLPTFALHKPPGVVTTVSDPQGRPTVLDVFRRERPDLGGERFYPVGRLDRDTEGLLLLTNDGDLALHLTHPRYALDKEYAVQVADVPAPADLQRLRQGVAIDGRPTAPARVGVAAPPAHLGLPEPGTTWLRIVIHEGRKRQIRRMLEAIGHPVARLIRLRIGPIRLGRLPPGRLRPLTELELAELRKAAGLPD
ncbi:MAG: rRNA pseudouridine synthase [Chloroflexi bacterium]|nr:rRNA pseudouridine synthase [Chloroflexota bacterium]